MKKNLVILSVTALTSVSSFAGSCGFKIVDRQDQLSALAKSEVVKVMNAKGYVYNDCPAFLLAVLLT